MKYLNLLTDDSIVVSHHLLCAILSKVQNKSDKLLNKMILNIYRSNKLSYEDSKGKCYSLPEIFDLMIQKLFIRSFYLPLKI